MIRFVPLILIAVIVGLALPTLAYPLGRDQGEFATIARGMLDGKRPYIDLWNPKPPAIFLVYGAAMGVFGRTAPAIRAIDLLIFPLMALALYDIAARIASRRAVGLWAILVFGAFYFTETFWTLTQNDGIALLPMLLAAACAVRAAQSQAPSPPLPLPPEAGGGARGERMRGVVAYAFACGLLSGVVIWFKYPFVFFIAILPVIFCVSWRSWRPGRLFAFLLPFTLGFAIVMGAGAAWLVAIGAGDAWIESARVTSGYTALGFNLPDLLASFRIAINTRWMQWGALFVLAAIGGVALLMTRAPTSGGAGEQDNDADRARKPHEDTDSVLSPPLYSPLLGKERGSGGEGSGVILALWLLSGLAILISQAKGYDYHWLPLLPPLAMVGAIGIDRFTRSGLYWVKWSRPLRRIAQTVVALVLIGMLASLWPRYLEDGYCEIGCEASSTRFIAGEFDARESWAMAAFLRARVVTGDSLFIWGFRPEIYYLSGLNPAVRFIFQYPLVGDWYPAAWREETVEILWAALPPYVLVLQADYMPWVTGSHDDSATLLQQYDDLNDWLIFNYERDAQIGNFLIWRRKP